LPGNVANAQSARLNISSLDRLESKAVETVDVTLDRSLLQLASKFLSTKRSPDEAKIKELVSSLEGVYVKHFKFDKEGQYSESEVQAIRNQLSSSGWSRIVGVRSKRKGDNVDVHIMTEGSVIKGLAVVAAEPMELTVVNIIGPIDLDKLSQLEGELGIPRLMLDRDTGQEKRPME
jgi:hypothetical protein